MQVTFLGTSSGVPTRARNVSSMALRLTQKSEIWLFDCGEGTQHQLLKSDVRLSQLKKIFISHMHGDHIFGLPGLLASIGLAGNSKGIEIYGPEKLEDYIKGVMYSSSSRIAYPINFHTVKQAAANEKALINEKDVSVKCTQLIHRVPTYAYRVEEKAKPGRFDIEKAQALRIPPGPIYAALKRGETVKINGKDFDGRTFSGPMQKGISMMYCTDTCFSEAAVELAKGVDLLIHEATYSHEDANLAYERKHSTSTMAAQTALEACANQLILTHLSPRYAPGNGVTANDLLNEAKVIFPNTLLAKDFMQVEIKTGCNSS